MKKILIIVIAVILVIGLVSIGILMQNKGSQPSSSLNSSSPINSGSQTNPALSNGPVSFKIQQAVVENNVDPTSNKGVSDHLEITLLNTIDKDISNINVGYSITDLKNSKNESYSVKLEGFSLKAHETQTIHFDNENKTNHFWANPYSMYYLSTDSLQFNIIVNAEGYQGQTISVKKDAGGAEQVD
jgi:hypothetical protein